MDELIREFDFYEGKVKSIKAKIFSEQRKQSDYKPKVFSQQEGENWIGYHGDSVEVIKGVPDNSVHYTIFSPPFSSLFTYSASVRDMGNSKEGQFYDHFKFLVPEMYRVLMPGRLLSFHCMDLPKTINIDGFIGLKDFPGELLRIFEEVGFIYHSKVVIWKDPLVQATRTKNLTLAHKQIVKDSTRCGAGLPDYIITVRKPGENPEPVRRKRGFEEYIGGREEPKARKNDNHSINKYSHYVWQRYASPVWMDIRQTNTLNIKLAKEKNDERHICPLQLDVVARCVELWTNKGDVVASWFAGIGTEGYQAIKMGRKTICVELKKAYYDIMIKNLESAEKFKNSEFKI